MRGRERAGFLYENSEDKIIITTFERNLNMMEKKLSRGWGWEQVGADRVVVLETTRQPDLSRHQKNKKKEKKV